MANIKHFHFNDIIQSLQHCFKKFVHELAIKKSNRYFNRYEAIDIVFADARNKSKSVFELLVFKGKFHKDSDSQKAEDIKDITTTLFIHHGEFIRFAEQLKNEGYQQKKVDDCLNKLKLLS